MNITEQIGRYLSIILMVIPILVWKFIFNSIFNMVFYLVVTSVIYWFGFFILNPSQKIKQFY